MKAIHYSDSAWKAVLAPLGGNLIRLQWRARELDILRYPHAYRLLEEKPEGIRRKKSREGRNSANGQPVLPQ